MDKPFLIDRQASSCDYGALLAVWASAPVSFRPFMLAGGFRETLLEVAKALIFGRHLVLFDADFSEEELRLLGGTSEKLELCESIAPLDSSFAAAPVALMSKIRTSKDFRITLFTSGSTGLPKQVTHTLQTLARGVRISPKHQNDIWAFAYNPTHIAGLQVFLQAIFNLNPLVDIHRCSPQASRERLVAYKVTHLSATPTFYRLLLDEQMPIATVSAVTLGGERTDPHLLKRVQQMFPNARVKNIYASTEAGTLLVADGEYFRIPDGSREFVRITQDRIEIHGSLLGKFDGTAGTAEWYDSGDVIEASLEDPTRFRVLGRAREWINVGGSKVNPTEVEAVLAAHPAILEARVYSRKNSVTGEIVCADVVTREDDFDERDVLQFVGEKLQSFKVPRFLYQVEAVEKTRSGKIKRNV